MIEKPSKTSPSKKRFLSRKITRFLGIFFLSMILLLVIAAFAFDHYLQSNKTKIFEQLAFLNHGSISFEETEISIYKNFPFATISLHNLIIKDSLFPQHQIPFLQAGELRAALSLAKLWEEEVELKSIELHDGQINFHTDSSGYNLLKALLPKPSHNFPAKKNNLLKDFKLRTDKLDVSLFNIYIHLTNAIKKSNIQGNAEQLLASLNFQDTVLSAEIDMQIALTEMTFNQDKGTFLKDSKLIGKPVIHFDKDVLTFDPFELKINEELFTFNGRYDTKKKTLSTLFLENTNTRWEKISPLLSDSIQMNISPYFIQNPFYTKTIIKGLFKRGEPVTVDINFRMEENELKVFKFDLNRVNLKGRFVNRFFDEVDKVSKKGITLEINKLSTNIFGFQLKNKNALITALRKKTPQLLANVEVLGNAKDISSMLSSNQFFFSNGYFDLTAQINSPINDFNQIMINSDATLELVDIDVYYKPADVVFPFESLSLSKKSGGTDFQLVSNSLNKSHDFQLVGFLENLPALLVELKGQQASSQAEFHANNIDWRDFIDWFGLKGKSKKDSTKIKSEKQKKKSLKQTIRGIQTKFQPNLSLNIDTLSYYGLLQIDNFLSNIYFEDENHLVLEKTSFDYRNGSVSFKARLDISDSLQTPFEFELITKKLNLKKLLPPLDYFNINLLANLEKLPEDLNLKIKHRGIIDDQTGLMANTSTGEIYFDIKEGDFLKGKINYKPDLTVIKDSIKNKAFTQAEILLEGDPSIFNNFLKTEKFFFSEGRFFFNFGYNDSHTNLENVLNSSNTLLKLRNSSVHYKPTGVDFPLTEIDLLLDADEAKFDFLIRSDSLQREVRLNGIIENLSELVIGNTGKSIKTTVDITSPKIIWNNFIRLFFQPMESEPAKKQNLDTLRATVTGIFETFDPSLKAHIDTFVITDNFTVNEFNTGIYMTDSSKLVLEQTSFNYYDGSASVNGKFDFNTKGPLPFEANFETKDLDVEKLLFSLDYLSLPSLKKIEKLSGRLTMNFNLSGLVAEDGNKLIQEASKGILDFKLDDVELRGMATLDSLAQKIRMKKRFAEVRFATIENRFTINGQDIEIPMMEVQSNAINLFLVGTLSYTDKTNIWIAIPLDNLKKRNLLNVPKKRGLAAAKRMVYVEVTTDEAGDNKFKFKLSRKKYYTKRGIAPLYRKEKREFKKTRKELKKQNQD